MEKKSYLDELEGIPFDSEALDRTKTTRSASSPEPEMPSDQVLAYLQKLNASSEVSIQLSKPLLWYIRSAETLYKQAAIYKREGDLEKAYILFMKFSILVLREMPKHSQYKLADHAALVAILKSLCAEALDYLERLKKELRGQYSKKAQVVSATNVIAETVPVSKQGSDSAVSRNRASWLLRQRDVERFNSEQTHAREKRAGVEGALVSYPIPPGPESEPAFTPESINQKLREASEKFLIAAPPESTAPAFPSVTKSWFSEKGDVLREVRVPRSIVEDFLAIAQSNTNRNLETCGIVAGNLKSDRFTVSTLIIPKQTATSDTCAMLHEEEVLECQDQEDLITVGWIHTHPTQACFLSSVDVHTQFPFQLLLPEAIAIVCAPTQTPNFGVFRLTDPPGMDIVAQCKITAPFHQHPSSGSIYKDISGPDHGHIVLDGTLPLKVIDLRSKQLPQ